MSKYTASLVVLYKDNKTNEYWVWLHKRNNKKYNGGKISVPCGHSEESDGNNKVLTALREATEESGVNFLDKLFDRRNCIIVNNDIKHTDIMLIVDNMFNIHTPYIQDRDETDPDFTRNTCRHEWFSLSQIRTGYIRCNEVWHRTKSSINACLYYLREYHLLLNNPYQRSY